MKTIDEVVTQITYAEWDKKEAILREYVDSIIDMMAESIELEHYGYDSEGCAEYTVDRNELAKNVKKQLL